MQYAYHAMLSHSITLERADLKTPRLKVCICLDYIECGLQKATMYQYVNSGAATHQHHRSPNSKNRQLLRKKMEVFLGYSVSRQKAQIELPTKGDGEHLCMRDEA